MRLAVVVVVGLLAPASAAPADDGSDPDHDSTADHPIRVRADLAGAIVRLQLTELIEVQGPGLHETLVDLPPRGVVVAASVRTGKSTTRPLALTAADQASTVVSDLSLGEASKTPGSAVMVSQPDLGPLVVTTVMPGRTTLVLDLVVEAPTCFLGDRRHVAIPATWAAVLDGATQHRVIDDATRAAAIAAACASGDEDLTRSSWLAMPTSELARHPPGDDRIGATAGRFAHGAVQAVRAEIALSSTLTEVPGDLATAFVIDNSRSVGSDLLDTQRAVIASYLRHAHGTRAQVIAFDRDAHAVLPGWSHARGVAAVIDRAVRGLTQRNGSNLDRGLAEAARWLARVPGTHRVVVFTDELLPERLAVLDPAGLAAVLPAGTVVQVVALRSGDAAVVRDDTEMLAPLADATEGIAVDAMGSGSTLDALALVRPISLDQLRVIAPGFGALRTAGTGCTDTSTATIDLHEGDACTWWATGPTTLDAITVEARIWGRRWQTIVPLGDRQSVATARELGFEVSRDTAPALFDAAELAARAVNGRWSLLATWGGRGGYDGGGDSAGSSGCGCDDYSSSDYGSLGTGTVGVTGLLTVEQQVAHAIAACKRDGATIGVALETTHEEIVGVEATVGGIRAAVGGIRAAVATKVRACVEAAVWNLWLIAPDAREHDKWSFTF